MANEIAKLEEAFGAEFDRIDADANEIKKDRHIGTVSGESLDHMGDLIDVPRKTGESDDKYRRRIIGEVAASVSRGTWDSVAQAAARIVDGEADEDLELNTRYDSNPATVFVSIDSDVLGDSPLTDSEIADILGKAVAAGHAVESRERGTLRLKSDNLDFTEDEGLTSDSISTGGTLSSDLV